MSSIPSPRSLMRASTPNASSCVDASDHIADGRGYVVDLVQIDGPGDAVGARDLEIADIDAGPAVERRKQCGSADLLPLQSAAVDFGCSAVDDKSQGGRRIV